MRISIIQQDILWADVAENIRKADVAIDSNPGADLYVLPEMFSTGFCTYPEGIAEDVEGESLKWMKAKAGQTGAAIAGSVAVHEDGKYYNRFYFVKPDGEVVWYDKKHLFTYGGEHEHFTAGSDRTVVEFKGVRILLEICYDLRFPVFGRNCDDYDVALYVANWPDKRRMAWDILLRARAIENQAVVIGVNRIGTDPMCNYDGGTVAIDFFGQVAARCEDNTPFNASCKTPSPPTTTIVS